MADVKISELTANASPAAADVAAVSNAAGTVTNKVTLQEIARLFSDPTSITGATAITNVVAISQNDYTAIGAGNYDAATLYVIQ
jgi:methenyltetrahydromethanopterin cyclohydrolase